MAEAGVPALVLPMDSAEATLGRVGGKGCALAGMRRAGLPVPDGFYVATAAYELFVEHNALREGILETVGAVVAADADAAARAAEAIDALFANGVWPEHARAAVSAAYTTLGRDAVAVRSSATAEDLPGMSFAGQHGSFLNVVGVDAVLHAVVRCWASLWSARAIAYRIRMGVDHAALSMGVVVQTLVNARAAGVLFTANPVSGARDELVVNASYGLGEAVVDGRVTPDTYVLARDGFAVKERRIGAKAEQVVAGAQGTHVEPLAARERDSAALTDEALVQLARLGLAAEAQAGGLPQDVEWAFDGARCWLLQSRPITGLQSEPVAASWEAPSAQARLLRRQVVENMPEPLSPLFESLYLHEGLDRGIDFMVADILELPFNLDEFIARPLFVTVNGYGYCRYEPRLTWRMLLLVPRMLYWYARRLPALLKNIIPLWRERGLPDYLAVIDRWRALQPDGVNNSELARGVRELAHADATYWFYITMMVGSAKITEAMLNRGLSAKALRRELISGMFLRGFPSSTVEAQQALAGIAARIAGSPALADRVLDAPAAELPDVLAHAPDGADIADELERYLDTYGHQVYNLDFVEPTQAENPLPLLQGLQAMVRRGEPAAAQDARRAQMIAERERLTFDTLSSAGPIRRRWLRMLLGWARKFAPYREEALFYMGAAWPVLRRLALELGGRLVAQGRLDAPDDVFYLNSAELERVAGNADGYEPLQARVEERRALRARRKKLHPPGRVPADLRFRFGPFDLTRFFEAWETQKRNAADLPELSGFAVSPGRVSGIASVINSPEEFESMQADTILVCPTTTPAWTPLFAQASALVTDIGAILAHGSIVAREYGIPAVLGTGNATQRIVTGQRVTVDGDAGTVTIHGDGV